ncbi:hypothetical protein [Paenibacillus sp. Marseille-Q4541]|uniref:hypothetical protein n=1 Tax=Paenibacillus sp. Marseille-Q4541 TaxID=2831522 RepID=UPI001BAAE5D8|nr:hypothetical protein [Paenibacillus sp. Marseille-Q4541]
MRRWCNCKQTMNLELRTVIFAKKIEIKNVPVFSCMSCSTYEVLKPVKAHLTEYLQTIEQPTNYQVVMFSEMNEVANLICDLCNRKPELDSDELANVMDAYKQERINLLLDVYQCALQMEDKPWMKDIQRRLEQLSQFRFEEHFSEAG